MSRTVARCQGCRYHVLDSFAALVGISIRPLPQARPQRNWNTPGQKRFEHSFSSSRLTSENQRATSEEEASPLDQPPTAKAPSSAASTPWYLQVQTPEPPAPISPHLALQDIPPIPEDAPPILSPILSHLSMQMGLDNLTLLDLRDVYPPPALGANLIMVLGTARSYKHLNTSADRFCRWLRSNYKLTPFADGLLGRNELKLKLRRRARRMKLAQSVGNTVAMGATEGGDDGITTGWVCVNVGAVDGVEVDGSARTPGEVKRALSNSDQEEVGQDEDEYKNPPDDTGVIGFGTRDQRPRIVVQMFTEEKRLEMDLEGLWDFREQRRERKEEKFVKQLGA